MRGVASKVLWRQLFCRGPGCGAMFYICRSCYRGQVYCGDRCRQKARRQQKRRANRRHQQSREGRLDHRDRQRAYRERCRLRRVPDHTSAGRVRSGNIKKPLPETGISTPLAERIGDRSRFGRLQAAIRPVCIAGGAATGRKLKKPVCHYSLSWAKDEKPDRQEMRRAAEASRSQLKLSKWAERYEWEQGKIRCPERERNNRRREAAGAGCGWARAFGRSLAAGAAGACAWAWLDLPGLGRMTYNPPELYGGGTKKDGNLPIF